jgi:M6 family metalloprotease-like protein
MLAGVFILTGCHAVATKPDLGPQSKQATGELSVLMVAVRFPDANPGMTLDRIRARVTDDLDRYIREQSYGQAWVKADFRGWVDLPDSLEKYKVSPYNFKVDRTRVRKLVEDTMTALEGDVDFSRYRHILIVPGVNTTPGKGYGMICYCANPGMLTGVKGKLAFTTLRSRGGKEFGGGVFVGAENAHIGMYAHDFFHALGGIEQGRRLAPCLYDFERQSDASSLPSFENHAIYMGAWDIMSQHFVDKGGLPPGLSSFTKIRLGWIQADQVVLVEPGTSAMTFLAPLSKKATPLTVKIPLFRDEYYLVENRQHAGYDRALSDTGLLVLKVNPSADEGCGTVKIMDAAPSARHFANATYRLDAPGRDAFVDEGNRLAVIPLWEEEGNLGVLITTPDKKAKAQEAARAISRLIVHGGQENLVRDCQEAFRAYDFKKVLQLASEQRGN